MQAGIGELQLIYRQTSGKGVARTMNYAVSLEYTDCNYGGRRVWFLCPAYGCGQRVAMLYLGLADKFTCRHCNKLAYRCQRQSADGRVLRKANNLRKRLRWPPGIIQEDGVKPKGMHSRTFNRLRAEYYPLAAEALGRISGRMEAVVGRLTRRWNEVDNERH